ncbi:cysteine dioxygenase [Alkalicoccobacillus murimartini]|uniref:Cysteine dioxygenase n=1 Tax=Alkalicoccobacillus murimartini TaxID=171685 RepID=A0ABT9YHG3_9BACI|nr:cysteine dioxygenase family protein [Alkalicoccobacillus murimartini]MDQ0207272.1 cysteine dioxygenase [Alkalicoccobacillus murimartini]
MDYLQRAELILQELESPTPATLRHALVTLDTTLDDLTPFLRSDQGKPYYRKLLFQNNEVELLMMNWSQIACAPHDHGQSYGWIQVISGTTINTVYTCKDGYLPDAFFSKKMKNSAVFFAPKTGIHHMKADGDVNLVTLHLYSPPIRNMKVYDLDVCAACIVSEKCGAWWPEEQREKIMDIQLKKHGVQPSKEPK